MLRYLLVSLILSLLPSFSLWSQTGIIAHRGFWTVEGSAQNSRSSVQNAVDARCYGAEIDVYLTTDGKVVLVHDPVIKGTRVDASSYRELSGHLLSNGETLPLLDEILPLIAASDHTRLVIEIKTHRDKPTEKAAVAKILELVERAGVQNKVEYIRLWRASQRSMRNCCVYVLTETWLNQSTANPALQLEGCTGLEIKPVPGPSPRLSNPTRTKPELIN